MIYLLLKCSLLHFDRRIVSLVIMREDLEVAGLIPIAGKIQLCNMK